MALEVADALVADTPAVAPFITATVGDASRPHAALPLRSKIDHLPGEGGLLVGIQNLLGWIRRGNAHLVAQTGRYGTVYRTVLGNKPVVCVADPEMLTRIARNDDRAWSTALAYLSFFDGLNPTSPTLDILNAMDFELHRDTRKVLQPAFGPSATAGYLADAQPMFERAVEGWVARGKVAFKPAVRRLLAEVSSKILIGIDDPAVGTMLDHSLHEFWGAAFALAKNPWLSPAWRQGMAGYRRLRTSLRPLVDERRASDGRDLFTLLCKESRNSDGPAPLDDDGVVRVFIGVLAAAFDTTSLGVTSMAYLLARHPEWQERLRQEALSIGRGPISYEDTKRLDAVDRVWRESLRLFPIAPHIPRVTLRDVEMGGFRIPAGTLVLALVAPLMQDPTWWTDPLRFDPDRFSEERAEDRRHRNAFVPFGSGAHACIGLHLANVEAKAFWHAMLTRCRFRLARDYEARHSFNLLGVASGRVELVLERL
jgi:cytochrome P450